MKTSTFVKNFKAFYKEETGESLDFRKHVYLNNQYGLTPCFNYSFAEEVVAMLYRWADDYVDDNQKYYPTFGGFQYNLSISCDKLRSSRLQDLIESVCERLAANYHKVKLQSMSARFEEYEFEVNDDSKGYSIVDVSCFINGALKEAQFTVQVSKAGFYESQNGCWIEGVNGGHCDFTEIEDIIFENFSDDIIEAGEKAAQDYQKNRFTLHFVDIFNCSINNNNLYVREDHENDRFDIMLIDETHNHNDYGSDRACIKADFESLGEALQFIESYKTNDFHDFKGFQALLDACNEHNDSWI